MCRMKVFIFLWKQLQREIIIIFKVLKVLKVCCQQHNYVDITCSINVSSPTSETPELLGSRLGGEVAEKCLFLCLSQTFSDWQKTKTGVNTGPAFPLWSKMRDKKGLKTHVEVATFLHNLPTLASGRFTLLLLACDNIRKRIAVRQTGWTAPKILSKQWR